MRGNLVVGLVWPLMGMIVSHVGLFMFQGGGGGQPSTRGQLNETQGDTGQAGDDEQVMTGERERHGCWASWAFDQYDPFHMFIGWMLYGVHSVHSTR